MCRPQAVHHALEDSAYDPTSSSGLVWCGAGCVRAARPSGPGAGAGRGDSRPSHQRPWRCAAGRHRADPGVEPRRLHDQRRHLRDSDPGRPNLRADGDAPGAHHWAQARAASDHAAGRRADGGFHARHGRQLARSRGGDGRAGGDRAGEGAVQRHAAGCVEAAGVGGRSADPAAGEDLREYRVEQRAAGCAAGRAATRADVHQRVGSRSGPALYRGRRDHQRVAPRLQPQRHRKHRGRQGRRGRVAVRGARR